jgi:16S rRNA (cytosine1402-N4)-methyltransferase
VNDTNDARFDSDYHAPVMVREVCEQLLGPRDDDEAAPSSPPRILDGTLGGGGHSAALLERGADVTGLDRDPNAIAEAGKRLERFAVSGTFRTFNTNFAEPPNVPLLYDGILLDLGVSSHQFDDETRGFSFREGAPLDMRMSGTSIGGTSADLSGTATEGATAAEWLNTSDESELAAAFREYADERKAGAIARQIVYRRANRPFATSDDLVGAIRAVHGPRSGPPEFARIFQAVRIAVNDELGGLARALPVLRDRLAPSGVIAVITYHSGEDRLVKHTFREWSISCTCPPRQPVCTCGGDNALGAVVTRKAIVAAADEILRNARARSAKLRAWRRRVPRPHSGA